MEEYGLVIRCMYNNQGWKGACCEPGKDPECSLCFDAPVNIRSPKPEDKVCSGHCWERYICTDYRWGCYPKGKTFARAYKGMKVFFAYKHKAGDYSIWGTSTVASIDQQPLQTGKDFEDGYKFIHFEPFTALPREQWITGLDDIHLVGASFRQGRFRYLDKERTLYFQKLISGEKAEGNNILSDGIQPLGNSVLKINLKPHIIEHLETIAQREGRTKDEIIREAIAEWLRNR